MKKIYLSVILLLSFLLSGCGYYDNWKHDKKYEGKTFKITTVVNKKTVVWENVTELHRSPDDEYSYTFYVNGAFVQLQQAYTAEPIIIEEIQNSK